MTWFPRGVFFWKYTKLLFITVCWFWETLSVGLFDFEWTYAISTRVKSHFWTVFGVKPFSLSRSQWPHIYSPMWNFMANLMVHITWLHLTAQKSFRMKDLEKVEKILKFLEFWKKLQHFSALPGVCFHINGLKLEYLRTEKLRKILGIQPIHIICSICIFYTWSMAVRTLV